MYRNVYLLILLYGNITLLDKFVCFTFVSLFKLVVRYPLVREGVYAPGGNVFLAHAMQRVSYIVDLRSYG